MGSFFSPGQPQAAIPGDLGGLRQQQIQLLQQLLGLGGGSSPIAPGNVGQTFQNIRRGPPAATGPLGAGDPLQRLQQFFGSLSPFSTTDAQRGATGVSQFLNQPSPEQRSLDIALPGLQEILTGGGPQFERDLALANQQGGRFGSANAILRGEAMRNLLNQRSQAAQTLGLLSQGAGAGQARQAGFADLETQRRLQILLNLLGVAQQASFNVPTTQSPSPFSQIAGLAGGILPFLGGGGGGSGGGAITSGTNVVRP